MRECGVNPLHHVRHPADTNDCWIRSSRIKLDTVQSKQLFDEFSKGKSDAIQSQEIEGRRLWHICAEILNGLALMQRIRELI